MIDSVVDGLRPEKPQNASAVGFSDLLWDFVQLCWDSDRTRRPTTTEVVKCLSEAATNWHTLMPATTTPELEDEPDPTDHQEVHEVQRVPDSGADAPPGWC